MSKIVFLSDEKKRGLLMALDERMLSRVVDRYLARFIAMHPKDAKEWAKFAVVRDFHKDGRWDTDAVDFLGMFETATAAAQKENLMYKQSNFFIAGVRNLCKSGEEDFVRDQFKFLERIDGKNPRQAQESLEHFCAQFESRSDKQHAPDFYQALWFLMLIDPANNYPCKIRDALYWDWNLTSPDMYGIQRQPNFSLESYYDLCNDTLYALKQHTALADRLEAKTGLLEEWVWHVAVYDIMFFYYQVRM